MMQSIKKVFRREKILPATEALKCSPKAIEKITEQVKSRPSGISSTFQIKINYKPTEVSFEVGFVEQEKELQTRHTYPVPIQMNEKDETYLLGSKLEYKEEENNFYIYPDIEIFAEPTPKKEIMRYSINRSVVSNLSSLPEFSIDRESFKKEKEAYPYLLRLLFKESDLNSIYILKNWIQVESMNFYHKYKETEEKYADIILAYFSSCAYPLIIHPDSVQTEYYP